MKMEVQVEHILHYIVLGCVLKCDGAEQCMQHRILGVMPASHVLEFIRSSSDRCSDLKFISLSKTLSRVRHHF